MNPRSAARMINFLRQCSYAERFSDPKAPKHTFPSNAINTATPTELARWREAGLVEWRNGWRPTAEGHKLLSENDSRKETK